LIFLALSPRIWVALALLFLYALLRRLIKQWLDRRRLKTAPRTSAALPSRITGGAERTWVVFTTPMCTTCDPVVERLRAAEPSTNVIKIDATVERDLADTLRIRTAPTAVLADARGVVRTQLVGADAVVHYLDGTT
jgi:hypothetical protein